MPQLIKAYERLNRDRDFLGLYHSRFASLVFTIWPLLIVLFSVLKSITAWNFSGWMTTVWVLVASLLLHSRFWIPHSERCSKGEESVRVGCLNRPEV